MCTLLDIFIAILVALMVTFFIGGEWSLTNPFTWISAGCPLSSLPLAQGRGETVFGITAVLHFSC